MSRDYVAEMRQILDKETKGGPYVPVEVAYRVVENLLAIDPELLDGWLRTGAVQFIRQVINQRDASARTSARVNATRERFGRAARTNNVEELKGFLDIRYTVANGARVKLSDMTAHDLEYVANDYKDRARDNLLQEVFLRKLATKVKDGKVEQYYTNEQLADMWRSLAGPSD